VDAAKGAAHGAVDTAKGAASGAADAVKGAGSAATTAVVGAGAATAAAVGGAATSSSAGGDAGATLDDAKSLYKKAKNDGAAWVNTNKVIKEAEKAAADGDNDAALKAAEEAKAQSEMALKQFEAQKNAGPRF
ncbi:MAG TPA: hypothetical protein DD827_10620, partial [Gammaproteobacteria bacterium]|nr:hypothetical protein [Gammaproteobacteria bacterium]